MLSFSPSYWSVFHFAEPQRNQGQTKGEKKMREPAFGTNPPTLTPLRKQANY